MCLPGHPRARLTPKPVRLALAPSVCPFGGFPSLSHLILGVGEIHQRWPGLASLQALGSWTSGQSSQGPQSSQGRGSAETGRVWKPGSWLMPAYVAIGDPAWNSSWMTISIFQSR